MAVLMHQNGIIENIKPGNHTFKDSEILNIFENYGKMRSKRILEVTNAWCVWAENKDIKYNTEDYYNTIASTMLGEDVFSSVLFIHDTEIDPNWKIIDTPIYKNYGDFEEEIMRHIDFIAKDIIEANQEYNKTVDNSNSDHLLMLNSIGPTEDKRILFELDMTHQDDKFWKDSHFGKFARQVYKYLKEDAKEEDTAFAIYADVKVIIIVRRDQIHKFIDRMIEFFQNREEYEKCAFLTEVMKKWNVQDEQDVPSNNENLDSSTNIK